MHRFYIDRIEGEIACLKDADQLHHLKDVLRLKVGDAVGISDGAGNDYAGVITAVNKKQAEISVKKVKKAHQASVKLTVACAIPKGSRLDEVIDFLTQLGVARIIPMRTERVVVRLDAAAGVSRLLRWRKIAQSAAQQSQRRKMPIIEPVTDFKDVVAAAQDYDLKLLPHLNGARKLLKEVIAEKRPENIIVLIGPEGDFAPAEVALALHHGFLPVSLGDTVLRVATAAIAVAAYIMFTVNG